jgi:hypothetical protein
MSKILQTFMYVVLLGTFIVSVSSCKKDDDPAQESLGTITGTVTDDAGQPIADVQVKVSALSETDVTVNTGADGKYTVGNVTLKTHSVTFSKTGWLTTSKSVAANSFDADNVATVNATLVNASSKITGTIVDAKNDDAPLADVTVSVGVAGTAQSGSDGTYTIENLVEDNYTVTFTKANYVTITRSITAADFVDGTATLDVTMGANEVLRGMTAEDLTSSPKWYYNEYRGGRNADAYPHWDWACDYMSASFQFVGNWEEQNEGTTLQIRNGEDEQSNPADLNVFDSYTYGSKKITADNKIMSVRLRTHGADEAAPANFGVQVVDLSAAEPVAVKVGENKTYGNENYEDFDFDLSAYVGKEVVIAIGIYRAETGDYYKQLVLRAVRFANTKVTGTNWLPGTEVVAGWQLTKETVASTMPQTKSSFTGISPIGGNRDAYVEGYRSWAGVNHIGAEWSFVPLKKDPEPFANEGYLIKTRATNETSLTVPEAYFYAKFSITENSNQLTFTTRNFNSTNYTFFKITAIENDGTVTDIEPSSNTATDASAAGSGAWKFKHEAGDAGNPEGYAAFVYDLSDFNGKDVTIVIGVYNGAADTGENKLVFHTIDLE